MHPRLPALCRSTTRSSALALALALAATLAATPAAAQPTAATDAVRGDTALALERCEAAVTETIRKLRGKRAQEVQFSPAQRVVTPNDETDISVKGAGRYHAGGGTGAGTARGTGFTFGCSFNAKTGLASGVVLREAGADSTARQADWQPDLSRVSPQACESAAAQLLKQKHPRVAQIAMEPDTRRLQPGPDNHILLLGQGAVQRAPGMNAVPFSYACEFDGRNGRLVDVKTSV